MTPRSLVPWLDPDRAVAGVACLALALALALGAALVLAPDPATHADPHAEHDPAPSPPAAHGARRPDIFAPAKPADHPSPPPSPRPAPSTSTLTPTPTSPSSPLPPHPSPLTSFDPRAWRLSGTFAVGDDEVAVIASLAEPGAPQRLYHVGDLLGGARVARIGVSRIELARGDERIRLALTAEPSSTPSSASTTPTTK